MTIKAINITMIVAGVILSITVWRRRHLAYIILYYELAMIMIENFVPKTFKMDTSFYYYLVRELA